MSFDDVTLSDVEAIWFAVTSNYWDIASIIPGIGGTSNPIQHQYSHSTRLHRPNGCSHFFAWTDNFKAGKQSVVAWLSTLEPSAPANCWNQKKMQIAPFLCSSSCALIIKAFCSRPLIKNSSGKKAGHYFYPRNSLTMVLVCLFVRDSRTPRNGCSRGMGLVFQFFPDPLLMAQEHVVRPPWPLWPFKPAFQVSAMLIWLEFTEWVQLHSHQDQALVHNTQKFLTLFSAEAPIQTLAATTYPFFLVQVVMSSQGLRNLS